jgi:hypothetical protein
VDALIGDYLRRLDLAAVDLPDARRAELEAEVREHIETALSEADARDEVTVRNVLERLGPPEEIVEAEATAPDARPSARARIGSGVGGEQVRPSARSSRLGAVEIIALLLLTVGSLVLPFVGPLLGLVFVWLSDRWSSREKLIATAIVVVLLALPFALFFGASAGAGLGAPEPVPPATVGP